MDATDGCDLVLGRRCALPRSTPPRLLFGLALLLLGVAFTSAPLAVADEAEPSQHLRNQAKKAEERGAWMEACRCYDAVARDKSLDKDVRAAARDSYQRCLRRLHLVARHSDPAYRQTVTQLTFLSALDTHAQVVKLLL